MLTFVIRRILSAAPALLIFAIGLFTVVAAAPPPAGLSDEELARRFTGLPLLFNIDPHDRPRMVSDAIASMPTVGEVGRKREVRRLLHIGGAGLGDMVAAMDRLAVPDRVRVARELAPLAFRMGLEDVADLDIPSRADRYWHNAYDARGADLRAPNVRRALRRHLSERSEPLYTRQLRNADTAALGPLVEALDSKLSAVDREEVETLAVEAAHRAGASQVRDESTLRAWWTVHHAEYVEFDPLERIGARITETRFGRWVIHAVTRRFGQSWRTGRPVLDDIVHRAPATLWRVMLTLILVQLVAVPLGLLSAARRDGPGDRVTRWVTLTIYAVPAFVLVMIARVALPQWISASTITVGALAAVTIPAVTRQARSAFLEISSRDFVRAARARGIGTLSLWLGHIGRNALPPIVSLAALQVPLVFAAALVAEEVIGLEGLGHATMEALRARDVPWLMALSLMVAVATTALLVSADLLLSAYDPRIRRSLDLAEGEI